MLDELIEKAVSDTIEKMTPVFRLEMKKAVFPRTIKGHEKAAELLDLKIGSFQMRLSRGFYVEGVHYEKKSDKIYLWDRDSLLDAEKSKRG